MRNFFHSLFKKSPVDDTAVIQNFKGKYECFRNLLESNAELLRITTVLQEALRGDEVFGVSFLRTQAARAVFHAVRIVASLNEMSGGAYPGLQRVTEGLREQIEAIVGAEFPEQECPFVLWHLAVGKESTHLVGGKNANLGEVVSRVGLPVPRGFAITVSAFAALLNEADRLEHIRSISMNILPDDTRSLARCGKEIEQLILNGPIPDELEQAIYDAWDRCFSPGQKVALRSSAVGEDSELSFAGQYISLMGIPREKLISGYREVVASLFSPQAVAYRLYKGVPLEESSMGVVCMEMVDSVASGVVYSRHPFHQQDDRVLVNAIWGHGSYLVDGRVSPDSFSVARGENLIIVARSVARKSTRLVLLPDGNQAEEQVEREQAETACLDDEQVLTLAAWALRLEKHYGCPQDMEWALDRSGRLLVVQTRPLIVAGVGNEKQEKSRPLPGREILLEAGQTACPGAGCGPVCIVENEEDIDSFPPGGVLVIRHSSPRYTLVLQLASAVVTDAGSIAGHMASLTREFQVPALLDTREATTKLHQGQIVTVDATSCRVYAGVAEELLVEQRPQQGKMIGSSVYGLLEKLAALIVPLNLTDPKSPDFNPEKCLTLHDVMRFAHERSYTEMFSINDLTSSRSSISVRLKSDIPFDLYVIDLGEGLKVSSRDRRVIELADVVSPPFLALIHGMERQDSQSCEPRPVQLEGFFSVLSQQMLAPPKLGTERFGDRSYALISDRYLNFSSRVGYHYGIVDAYCGKTLSKNYVNFEFKGGAADATRRNRRVVAISRILEKQDFAVEVTGDRAVARFQKYECEDILVRLNMLGRLLIFTRQMDMLMNSDRDIDNAVSSFLRGDHELNGKEGEKK